MSRSQVLSGEELKLRPNNVPSILDDESEVVFCSELDRSLYVGGHPRVDTDDRHAALATWHVERGVQIACFNRAIGKRERLVVSVLHCTALIRAPVPIGPTRYDGGACRRVRAVSVAGDRRWLGISERLG